MSESTFNQYAAPTAAVADVFPTGGTAELRMFSTRGRIGRLRYLAYVTGAGMLFRIFATAGLFVAGGSVVATALYAIALLVVLWFDVITGIKRCHDLNLSGWWALTMIFPLIVLVWIFAPGGKETNRFGPPPPPNNWGVRVLGLLLPIVALIGVLAAVALPAYSAYQAKARAAAEAGQQR